MTSCRSVYADACDRLRCKKNAMLMRSLPDEEGRFDLREIDLSLNLVGRQGILPVLEVVRYSKLCSKLCFADNFLTNDNVKEIIDVVSSHPAVDTIDLSRNPISHPAGKLLSEFARRNSNIRSLVLEETLINPALVRIIYGKVRDNVAKRCVTQTPPARKPEASPDFETNLPQRPATSQKSLENTITTVAVSPPPPLKPTVLADLPSDLLGCLADAAKHCDAPATELEPWWCVQALHSLSNEEKRTQPGVVKRESLEGPTLESGLQGVTGLTAATDPQSAEYSSHQVPLTAPTADSGSPPTVPPLVSAGRGLQLLAEARLKCVPPSTNLPPWWGIEAVHALFQGKLAPALKCASFKSSYVSDGTGLQTILSGASDLEDAPLLRSTLSLFSDARPVTAPQKRDGVSINLVFRLAETLMSNEQDAYQYKGLALLAVVAREQMPETVTCALKSKPSKKEEGECEETEMKSGDVVRLLCSADREHRQELRMLLEVVDAQRLLNDDSENPGNPLDVLFAAAAQQGTPSALVDADAEGTDGSLTCLRLAHIRRTGL